MKVKPFCTGESLDDFGKVYGDILDIKPSELYVKPFYSDGTICYWSVCSNKDNEEILLANYCDTDKISAVKCAKSMICIIQFHRNNTEPFEMMNHQEILQWLKGTEKLLKAIKDYKE